MSDHHVDTMNIDYSAKAKEILLRTGMYKPDCPPINHHPGNDFLSDVRYPFPNYPDNRFAMVDNGIKDDSQTQDKTPKKAIWDIPNDEDMPSEDMIPDKVISNPEIEYWIKETLLSRTVFPYTGLAFKAKEKKAFDISYIQEQKVVTKEVITGHLYSMCTFDGSSFHIFRGKCVDIIQTNEPKVVPKSIPSKMSNLYVERRDNPTQTIRANMRFVLEVSTALNSKIEFIPLNQIIGIGEYNDDYDTTIYNPELKYHIDWWELLESDEKLKVFVPAGVSVPEQNHYPVIEHQPKNPKYDG